ncbi:MAG: OmpA family protein [Candidatus Krumholzibacteria bacterium]
MANGAPGDSYVEIQARSVNDTTGVVETSVVRVTTLASLSTLHFGPYRNARALPRGEGSPDDVSLGAVGYTDFSITFRNDVSNGGGAADVVEMQVADSLGWPPGTSVTFRDTTGALLTVSPLTPGAVLLGTLAVGETRSVLTTISTPGTPFFNVINDSLSVRLLVRSRLDTARVNRTVDRIVIPATINPAAVIRLDQTFKDNTAGFGDVVTLIVSVQNVSDSLQVDNVIVREMVQPTLNFLSSPSFARSGAVLRWAAGTLAPGEKRETVIKFIANSRVARGKTKVIGEAQGIAITGDMVFAGPVVNVLRIENDIFSSDGIILGDVFVDEDGDGERGGGEQGVGGVAVYVESGEYAVTDSLGKFSIPRVFSGYRVLRLDESTLPPDVTPGAPRGGGAWNERLIHLLASGNAVVSFPVRRTISYARDLRTRSISLQELVSVTRRHRALYQIPSVPSSNFLVGKAFLKTGTLGRLDPIRTFLIKNPGWMVLLEGHTDNVPMHNDDFASNLELSVARAEAVKRYIMAKGITEHRIEARGYGAQQPIAANQTREGRARNRRVEISFVPQGVSFDDASSIKRVATEIEQLEELPDTFQVRIVWDISTNSPHPRDAELVLEVPAALRGAKRTVRSGGEDVGGDGTHYHFSDFRRSRGIQCEVTFRAAAPDTALIRRVRASLVFEASRNGWSTREPGATWDAKRRTTAISALASGGEPGKARHFVVERWMEEVPRGLNDSGSKTGDPDSGRDQQRVNTPGTPAAGLSRGSQVSDSILFGFLEPSAGDVYTRSDGIRVRVRVPVGSAFVLERNGDIIPAKRIGEKVINVRAGWEDVTYYGVKIERGWNSLVLNARPVSGPARSDTLRVALAGRPARLAVEERRRYVPADGQTTGVIRIAVLDEVGLPVVDGVVGTVSEGAPLLAGTDKRPDERGLQLTTEGGYLTLRIKASTTAGRHKIVVTVGDMQATVDLRYIPRKRPLLVTGIAEGTVGVFNTSGAADPLGLDDFDESVQFKGVSRLFVQGTLYRDVNLTVRLDSKKRYKDPVLKTLGPDRQYSFYGDSSELGFAAPSESGNYVALQKNESFLRYGDFQTPLTEGEFLKFQRSSTGVNGEFRSGDHRVKAFVTKTDFSTFKDEIPGDGTSGFYYLTRSPVVENTVNIVLETRDRFQPERVIEVHPQVINRDYTINYFNGAILFKQPVAVTTRAFNPVVIVAIYEVETDEEADYLYGFRGEVARGSRYRVGTTAVAQGGSDFDYALYGLNGSGLLGPLNVSGEFARSQDELAGAGSAYKIEGALRNATGKHSLYYRRVDGDFVNPSFTGGQHELFSRKTGFDSRTRVSKNFLLESNGFVHQFDKTGEEKKNLFVLGTFETPVAHISGGIRAAEHEDQGRDDESLLSVVGGGLQARRGLQVRSQWEKNLTDETVEDYPDRLKSTASVPVLGKLKLVVNHEYLSAHGRSATQRLLAGVESYPGKGSSAYTKYSMSRTAGDERIGALSGIRHKAQIKQDLYGSLDVEGFRSFSNSLDDEYVTVKSGLNWLDRGAALVEGQYEVRWQRSMTRHLIRLNAIRQFGNGIALLFRDALSVDSPDLGRTALRSEGRIAAIYRPDVSRIRALFLLKNEYDRFSPVDPDAITLRLVLSTDVNVILAAAHEIRLKLAFKHVEDYSIGISENTNNYLLLSQYVHHFRGHWDVDLWARYLGQNGAGTRQLGTGIELGRTFLDRIRLGAGYSVNGFEERDLAQNDAWQSGFSFRVQLILSEWILNELGFPAYR